MIEQRARFRAGAGPLGLRRQPGRRRGRRVRARACPGSGTGREENFDFAGYVTGFDPAALHGTRARCARGSGSRPDEKLCLVTVGGSGVGAPLLRRVLDAVPLARRLVPELRFLFVTGPRIDPASLPAADGVEVVGLRAGPATGTSRRATWRSCRAG